MTTKTEARVIGYVELPGTLHIESSRLPLDRTTVLYLEVVTDWAKTL